LPAHHSSREFGSWHWPRCGIPDVLHKDITQLNIFLNFWNSEDAILNPLLPSEPVDVEQAYSTLLKVGLLAHDCVYSLHSWKHEYKYLGNVSRKLRNNSLIDPTPTLVKLESSTADRLSQARDIFPPPFHTSSSQSNLPPQPYSARTALSRVASIPAAAEVRRREGHAQYQQGLEQRRINREIRRATLQGAPTGKSVEISQNASEPDATPTSRPTAGPGCNGATRTDASVSDKPNASPQRLRKRKQNVVISDSERAASPENSPGHSNYSGQLTRASTPVPRSKSRKGSFVILLLPVRHPTKSIKRRLGN